MKNSESANQNKKYVEKLLFIRGKGFACVKSTKNNAGIETRKRVSSLSRYCSGV